MVRKIIRFFLYAIGCSYCASFSPPARLMPEDQLAALKQEYIQARKNPAVYTELNSKIRSFLKQSLPKESEASGLNLLGLILIQQNKPSIALQAFQKAFVLLPPQHPSYATIAYNFASCLETISHLKALEVLDTITVPLPPEDNILQSKIIDLKIRLTKKIGSPQKTLAVILKSAKLLEGLPAETILEKKRALIEALEVECTKNTFEASHLPPDWENSLLADAILYYLAASIYYTQPNKALEYVQQLTNYYPDSVFYKRSLQLIQTAYELSQVQPQTIGVILPLKGKLTSIASHSLYALSMGLGLFDEQGNLTGDYKLIIEDSGEDNQNVIQALQKLVTVDQAIAVVGPLLSKQASEISQEASRLKIPLFTLTRKNQVDKPYVKNMGFSLDHEIEELARHARQTLKFSKFAIMTSSDKASQLTAFKFWDTIESLGGQIQGFEVYSPFETDFRNAIDRLTGASFTELRTDEIKELAKKRKEKNIYQRTKRTEKYFLLPPIVDFEAVFIADEPKIVTQIQPTFAYRDVERIKYLGLSAWNNKDFFERAGVFGKDSFFVDSISPTKEQATAFEHKYFDWYEKWPTAFELAAYQTGLFLKKHLNQSAYMNRYTLYQAMQNNNFFTDLKNNLYLLTVENQEAKLIGK